MIIGASEIERCSGQELWERYAPEPELLMMKAGKPVPFGNSASKAMIVSLLHGWNEFHAEREILKEFVYTLATVLEIDPGEKSWMLSAGPHIRSRAADLRITKNALRLLGTPEIRRKYSSADYLFAAILMADSYEDLAYWMSEIYVNLPEAESIPGKDCFRKANPAFFDSDEIKKRRTRIARILGDAVLFTWRV